MRGVPLGRIYVLPLHARRRASRSQIRPRRRRPWSLLRQIGLVIRARQQFPMRRGAPRAFLLLVARLLLMLLLTAGRRSMRCGRSRAIAGNASGWCVQLRRLQILYRADARRGTPPGSRRWWSVGRNTTRFGCYGGIIGRYRIALIRVCNGEFPAFRARDEMSRRVQYRP